MSDDVFSGDQPTESVLDALVGEGKKFDNVEALAKGKLASDDHIARIEQENADLKAKLEQAGGATIEDIKAKLEEIATQKRSEGEQTMSNDDLETTIRDVLTSVNASDTKESNRAKGNALVLDAVDGDVDAAKALVAERASQLGMSPKGLAELSEQSPEAFARLMQLKDSGPAPSQNTQVLPGQRTDNLGQGQATMEIDGFKTKAWFDAKRKEMGHAKWLNDQKIQRELARSMNGLGSRYYES